MQRPVTAAATSPGIGPVTVERGYTYGGAIINGRSTQGVALAASHLNCTATIVMPKTTPMVKVMQTEAVGGKVINDPAGQSLIEGDEDFTLRGDAFGHAGGRDDVRDRQVSRAMQPADEVRPPEAERRNGKGFVRLCFQPLARPMISRALARRCSTC